MGLTNENVGPKILAKIKIYVLTRAELLFKVCYEIPCMKYKNISITYVNKMNFIFATNLPLMNILRSMGQFCKC